MLCAFKQITRTSNDKVFNPLSSSLAPAAAVAESGREERAEASEEDLAAAAASGAFPPGTFSA
jgi:hypothetical protein